MLPKDRVACGTRAGDSESGCRVDLGLRNKVAVVTGGARGIGKAIAESLAIEGAAVAIFDREGPSAQEAARAVRDLGARAIGLEVDVSKSEAVDAAVAATVKELGGLHVMVCNAGITRDGPSWKMTDAQWQSVLDVNLNGYFYCNRAAARVFKDQKQGRIVNVASINGLRGKFGQANYTASKGGVIALSKTLAKELGKFNVNVNVVAPGMVLTEMMAAVPPEFQATALAETVLGRFATPQDVAELIVFLVSDRARHVTGEVIKIDGGQYI